jgi:hypothetical protein
MLSLGIKRREAVGIIGCLSSWAIQYRPGGTIERHLIHVAVEWDGDREVLVQALLKAAWIDEVDPETVRIHDWKDITKGYRKAREDAARRKRGRRATVALQSRGKRDVGHVLQAAAAPSGTNGTSGAETGGGADAPHPAPPPASPAKPSAAAPGVPDDMAEVLNAARDAKVFAASEKQRMEILASWLARDGKDRVLERLRSSPGQDLLKLFDAGKGPPPFRPKASGPKPCRKCDGTGRVVDHEQTTPTQTALKPCVDCKGKGRAAS